MVEPSDHPGHPSRLRHGEFARLLGITPAALTAARKRGVVSRGEDDLYDVETEARRYKASQWPQKAAASASDDGKPDLLEYKTRAERERWRKLVVERRQKQGALVLRELVDSEWARLTLRVRDAILQVPHAAAAQLAAETDPRACRDILLDALEQALTRLAEEAEAMASDGDDDDEE